MKSKYKILLGVFLLLTLFPARQSNAAESSETLTPQKDTYLSIGGTLGEPLANFGLAEYLDIGKGGDGICVTLIQYDLTAIEAKDGAFSFTADATVYGDHTRTVKVFLVEGVDWSETEITGNNSPMSGTVMWGSEANLTTATVGGSSDEISFTFTYTKMEVITLCLCTDAADDSWISIPSRENEYSWNDPATLTYLEEKEANSLETGFIVVVIVVVIFAIVRYFRKDTKKIPARQPPSSKSMPPTSDVPAEIKLCPKCQARNPVDMKFCSSCGSRL